MTGAELARACADAMWREDHASQGLNIAVEHIAPGMARLSMLVERRMINGTGTCHGGFIFALADSAFAFVVRSALRDSGRTAALTGASRGSSRRTVRLSTPPFAFGASSSA